MQPARMVSTNPDTAKLCTTSHITAVERGAYDDNARPRAGLVSAHSRPKRSKTGLGREHVSVGVAAADDLQAGGIEAAGWPVKLTG